MVVASMEDTGKEINQFTASRMERVKDINKFTASMTRVVLACTTPMKV